MREGLIIAIGFAFLRIEVAVDSCMILALLLLLFWSFLLLSTIFTTLVDNPLELVESPWKTPFVSHGVRTSRSQLRVSSIATREGFYHERGTEWSNKTALPLGSLRSGTSWAMLPGKGSHCGKLCGMATSHMLFTGQTKITLGFCPSVISSLEGGKQSWGRKMYH